MEMWLDAHKYAEGLMILRDRFNFDGILVSVHGHFEDWRSRIDKLEIVDGIEVATFTDRQEKYADDDLPADDRWHQSLGEMTELVEIVPGLVEYVSDGVEQRHLGICVMTTDEEYPAMYQDKGIAQGRQWEIPACHC